MKGREIDTKRKHRPVRKKDDNKEVRTGTDYCSATV
jgi:hypothetical protein